MSNSKITPKTLTTDELAVLMNFYHTKDTWDKAGTANISIAYDDQYRDFEVITAEEVYEKVVSLNCKQKSPRGLRVKSPHSFIRTKKSMHLY